jgi:hypothetical protein
VFFYTHEAAGASTPGIPHALYSRERRNSFAKLGRIASRDRGVIFEIGATSLRRAKRRSNPFSVLSWLWIASRSLSSGAHSRDPLARNDGGASLPTSHFKQPAAYRHGLAISPRLSREFYLNFPSSEIRGRRECRAHDAPAASRVDKKHAS